MELTADVFSFFVGHCRFESVREVGFDFSDHAWDVSGNIGLCILRGEARVTLDPNISVLNLCGKMAYLLGDAVSVSFAAVTLFVGLTNVTKCCLRVALNVVPNHYSHRDGNR